MLPPAKQPSPPCNDRPDPLPDCTPMPFTKPEVADDDETGNGIPPICGGGGQAAERYANEFGLPEVVPLTARKSPPSLDMDSGVDELDLSCDGAAAAAALDVVEVPAEHDFPSLTSTGTATRFGGELTVAADELVCCS